MCCLQDRLLGGHPDLVAARVIRVVADDDAESARDRHARATSALFARDVHGTRCAERAQVTNVRVCAGPERLWRAIAQDSDRSAVADVAGGSESVGPEGAVEVWCAQQHAARHALERANRHLGIRRMILAGNAALDGDAGGRAVLEERRGLEAALAVRADRGRHEELGGRVRLQVREHACAPLTQHVWRTRFALHREYPDLARPLVAHHERVLVALAGRQALQVDEVDVDLLRRTERRARFPVRDLVRWLLRASAGRAARA